MTAYQCNVVVLSILHDDLCTVTTVALCTLTIL